MTTSLSTLQRSLVALTALHLHLAPRAQVLAQHHVTEDDLGRHRPEWERLQALRAAACFTDNPQLHIPGQRG